MTVLEWAKSVKPDLVKLQATHGIPALWAAAQMCHESAVGGGSGLSELAAKANNYAGLKWASWEAAYGCSPVNYGTWEVLNGQRVDLTDAFCSCPSWAVWLQVYAGLLTSSTYSPALAFAADPLLYGLQVWQCGWATDPAYLTGVGWWMQQLLPTYEDTLPVNSNQQVAATVQPPSPVTVKDSAGNVLCQGWLEQSRTVVPLRDLAEKLGFGVDWDGATRSATLTHK